MWELTLEHVGLLKLYRTERMADDLAVWYVVNVDRKWALSHFLFVVIHADNVMSYYK